MSSAARSREEGNTDTDVPPENLMYPNPRVEEGEPRGERRGTELNDAQVQMAAPTEAPPGAQ